MCVTVTDDVWPLNMESPPHEAIQSAQEAALEVDVRFFERSAFSVQMLLVPIHTDHCYYQVCGERLGVRGINVGGALLLSSQLTVRSLLTHWLSFCNVGARRICPPLRQA
jgi:hypothetical protein